jgi:hypothetical protein
MSTHREPDHKKSRYMHLPLAPPALKRPKDRKTQRTRQRDRAADTKSIDESTFAGAVRASSRPRAVAGHVCFQDIDGSATKQTNRSLHCHECGGSEDFIVLAAPRRCGALNQNRIRSIGCRCRLVPGLADLDLQIGTSSGIATRDHDIGKAMSRHWVTANLKFGRAQPAQDKGVR